MRVKSLRTVLVVGALAASLMTAGCGADKSAANVIVVGDYPNSSLTLPLTVARDRGFFKDVGLELDVVNVSSGPDLVASLIGGSTDIAVEVPDNVMPAMEQGEPILALPPFGRLDMNIVTPPDAGIDTLEDLIGKKVGVVARGANSEKFFRTMLEENGLDPDGVTYVAIGAPSVQAASLEKGAVVATAVSTSTVTLLNSQGVQTQNLASTLQGTAGALGDYGLQTFWGTTEKYYTENPEKIDKFCDVMTRATEWIADTANRTEGIDLLARHMKLDEASAAQIWDDTNMSWSRTVTEKRWSQNANWVLGDATAVPYEDAVRTGC